MSKTRLVVGICLPLFLSCYFSLSFAQGESITLSTYYPSPYGVYSILRLYPGSSVVTPDGPCSSEGEISYHNLDNTLYVCSGSPAIWRVIAGKREIWTYSSTNPNDIYNTNSGNVGIETNNPQAKLHVASGEVRFPAALCMGGPCPLGDDSTRFNSSEGRVNLIRGSTVLVDKGGAVSIGPMTYPQAGAGDAARVLKIGNDIASYWFQAADGSLGQAGALVFGDGSGWKFHIARPNSPTETLGASAIMTFSDTKKVGISEENPERMLVIGDDVAGVSFDATSGSPNAGYLRFGDGSGWKFHIGRSRGCGGLCGGTTGVFMTVTDQGNVGIGTLDPSTALEVVPRAGQRSPIRIRDPEWGTGVPLLLDNDGYIIRQSSSKLYKKNIKEMTFDSSKILELKPVKFQYKNTNEEDMGLIAEEVDKINKDLVIYDKQGHPEAVKYDKVSLYLLEIIKEQQRAIHTLQQAVRKLQDEFKSR